MDDLVDIVLRDEETLQEMLALAGLFEVVLRAAGDDLLLIGEVFVQNVAEGEYPRLLLVIDQREHIDGEGGLELRLREKAIQNDLRVRVALDLDDNAHTGAVGLVANVGNALQLLVVDLIGHVFDEHPLVDLIGQLGDDDADAVLAELLELRAGAENELAAAGGVGGADTRAAHDDAPCREVGACDVGHQIGEGGLRIVEHADAGVDDLGEVMGRDIGRHTDGDTGRAVDEQVREAAGQDARLLAGLVEVGVPIDGVLINVAQHFVGEPGHTSLGIAVGRRRVAIDGAEVAVPVHEHIAHGEVLRETDEGVVNGGVAVGMVAAEHVANAGGGFFEGFVVRQAVLIHGVEDAAVDGLQTVAHIGQGAANDDGHGVLDVGGRHFMHELARDDLLVGETNVLGLVVYVFMGHF